MSSAPARDPLPSPPADRQAPAASSPGARPRAGGLVAARTWRRDGTTNLMGLDDAVANLARFHPHDPPGLLRQHLLDGGTLGTPLATFRLALGGYGGNDA